MSWSLHGHDRRMSMADSRGVTLELESGADPIRGSIRHPDGSRTPFWGWLELMEELRRVAANQPETPVEPIHVGTGPDPEAPDLEAEAAGPSAPIHTRPSI